MPRQSDQKEVTTVVENNAFVRGSAKLLCIYACAVPWIDVDHCIPAQLLNVVSNLVFFFLIFYIDIYLFVYKYVNLLT